MTVLNDYQYDRGCRIILVSNEKGVTRLILHIPKVAVTIIYHLAVSRWLVRTWKNLTAHIVQLVRRSHVTGAITKKSNEITWYWL